MFKAEQTILEYSYDNGLVLEKARLNKAAYRGELWTETWNYGS